MATATRALTGASSPRVSMSTRPLRRVDGRPLPRWARSRSCIVAASAESGQAANGCTVASARSIAPGAASLPICACSASVCSGPRAVRPASQGRAAPSSERASACASRPNGASLAITARPFTRARSHTNASWLTRCSAPARAPSSALSAICVSGGWPSRCSAPTRASGNTNAIGRRRLAGRASGSAEAGPLISTRSARKASIVRPIQAPSCGRQRQCASCQASPFTTSVRRPSFSSMRSARNGPPASEPCVPLAVRPGTRASSHALPPSLRASHARPPASSAAPNTSTASNTRSQRRGRARSG